MPSITIAVLLSLLCCCCSAQNVGRPQSQHDHLRTKSGAARLSRTQGLTDGMPAVAAATDQDPAVDGGQDPAAAQLVPGLGSNELLAGDDGRALRDYLFRSPSNLFRGLMRTGVNAVQQGMDTFQGVSSAMFKVARQKTGGGGGRSPVAARSVSAQPTATVDATTATNGGSAAVVKRQTDAGGTSSAAGRRRADGFPGSVFKMIDTGIAGVEQVTDLGLLLGNIGTHKIRAGLDGKSGNQEIYNLLIKYVGSRVAMGSKGSAIQMIDDVGIISTFVATDDEVTNSMSTMMAKLMGDPEVSAAMVRVAISVLDSSPSTACVLDQLPLSPADVRMLFDVFVGNNGQTMMKTIAGLLSDLTTGPDTRAFLESVMAMMSMFKSDPAKSSAESAKAEKPKSMLGSLTGFFTGADDSDVPEVKKPEQQSAPVPPAQPPVAIQKKPRDRSRRPAPATSRAEEDPWFKDDEDEDGETNQIKPRPASDAKSVKIGDSNAADSGGDNGSGDGARKTKSRRGGPSRSAGGGDDDAKAKTRVTSGRNDAVRSKRPPPAVAAKDDDGDDGDW